LRFLTALLVIAALGILALFLKPLLQPQTVRGPKPEGFSPVRVQTVTSGVTAARATDARASTQDSMVKSASRPTVKTPSSDIGYVQAEKPDGPLCDREFDEKTAGRISLPSSDSIRAGPPVDANAWTWVNVWAVWCKPCKEEMPLLSSWAASVRKRGGALKVLFLSVDDDERQLSRFMKSAGKAIDGDFRWVRDEAARVGFYRALGTVDSPTLPIHALFDPKGRLRCVRIGSVDSASLSRFLGKYRF